MSRALESNSWSRRRAAVRAEAEADRQAADRAVRDELQATQADKSDADILAELSLQDPDEMRAGDDFSAFMRDEVPERLRKRALRSLWRSNPVLACVDDLVDYGDDFKAEWNAGEVIRTTYQVGKGMLAHVKEMERQAEVEARAEIESEIEATSETDAELEAGTYGVNEAEDVLAGPDVEPETVEVRPTISEPEPEAEPQFVPMRRMRFEFDSTEYSTEYSADSGADSGAE